MNGLSNKLSATIERQLTAEAIKRFDDKVKTTGKVPGTHTLGEEFSLFYILNQKFPITLVPEDK